MRRLSASAWLVLLPILLCAAPAWADGPFFTDTCNTISWTANTEVDLAGYNLYDRTSLSNPYTKIATVGIQITSVLCSQLNFNMGQHYVSLTAFDTSGNESAHTTDIPFYLAHNLVSDLRVTIINATDMTLAWTEVDDGTGAPANYDVRIGTPTINWGAASSVTSGTCSTPVAGTAIGATKTCTVTSLALTTPYQFQLVPYHGTLGSATFGPLSNIASGTTGGSVPGISFTTVISEGFARANAPNLGSNWTVVPGKDPITIVSQTAQPTQTLLPSAEYYSVQVLPNDQWASTTVSNVGGTSAETQAVFLRYTDANNYIRVGLGVHGTPTTRIDEMVGGSLTESLFEDNSQTWVASDVMLGTVIGMQACVSRNGVQVGCATIHLTGGGASHVAVEQFIDTGGTLTNNALASVQAGTFGTAVADICGCDNH